MYEVNGDLKDRDSIPETNKATFETLLSIQHSMKNGKHV